VLTIMRSLAQGCILWHPRPQKAKDRGLPQLNMIPREIAARATVDGGSDTACAGPVIGNMMQLRPA
jgi:hypothetical protein